MPALTSDSNIVSGAIESSGRLLARQLIGEVVTALISDPAYPAILFPKLFNPGRGC